MEYQGENFHLHFDTNFLSVSDAESLFLYLEQNVEWNNAITPGKRVNQTYGDDGVSYELIFKEKTIRRHAKPWLPILKYIRDKLTDITGSRYNYCVVQRYPNGRVGISPHKDREMEPNCDIVGISLGSTRTLTLTPPYYNRINKTPVTVILNPGSMYILKPPTNRHWMHSIEKDVSINSPRISITYRLKL